MINLLALTVLAAALFLHPPITRAETEICGDHDANGSVGATDALRLLRHAVGQPVSLECPDQCALPGCGDDSCDESESCLNCASDCGACSVCAGASDETAQLDATEQAFLSLLNDHRADEGLGALLNCTSLSRSAQGHAEDMRDENYFSNIGKDGSASYDRACSACYEGGCGPQVAFAEVIGAGYATANDMMDAFKSKDGTNDILLLSGMVRVGIGRATGGGDYGTYWVVDLASATEASCN